MPFIVFGKSSRLAKTLAASQTGSEVISFSRQEYANLRSPNLKYECQKFLASQNNLENCFLLNCVGITNPNLSFELINRWNFEFALELLDFAKSLGTKYISIGSMSEDFLSKVSQNSYMQTKKKLTSRALGDSDGNWLHLRLHSLYGVGVPISHSFLGQIYSSLSKHERLNMTSGQQLREYHHYIDEVSAINTILQQDCKGVIDLSAGNAIHLSELAQFIFDHFNLSDYLQIGGLSDLLDENFDKKYLKDDTLNCMEFRNPLSGIKEWFIELGVLSHV